MFKVSKKSSSVKFWISSKFVIKAAMFILVFRTKTHPSKVWDGGLEIKSHGWPFVAKFSPETFDSRCSEIREWWKISYGAPLWSCSVVVMVYLVSSFLVKTEFSSSFLEIREWWKTCFSEPLCWVVGLKVYWVNGFSEKMILSNYWRLSDSTLQSRYTESLKPLTFLENFWVNVL